MSPNDTEKLEQYSYYMYLHSWSKMCESGGHGAPIRVTLGEDFERTVTTVRSEPINHDQMYEIYRDNSKKDNMSGVYNCIKQANKKTPTIEWCRNES